jgi:ribosome-binding protein aMBF1 (putative translation factor)
VKKPTFVDVMRVIESEAKAEGPRAVARLVRMRHRYQLGGQLAMLRKRHGISQVDLATKSGVEQADISKIERGLSNPTQDTLARLGHALGVHLAFVDDREPVAV